MGWAPTDKTLARLTLVEDRTRFLAARTNSVAALGSPPCAAMLGRGQSRPILCTTLVPILARMEIMVTRHRHKQSRDELLARYERGVWTYFLAALGFALFGIVVWIGLLVL